MLKKIYYILITCIILFFLFNKNAALYFKEINMHWLFLLLLAFFMSQILTPVVKYISTVLKILDYPDKRKVHKVPIPRLGGLVIFIVFIIMTLMNFNYVNDKPIIGLLIGCFIIVFIGVIDDAKGVTATVKLLGQVVAACVVIYFGIRITFIPHFFMKDQLEVLISIVWIIGITNAINFLDGMDGLATGLSIISAISVLLIALPTGQSDVAYISIVLIGCSAGFLLYNFKPAKIFLGDSGSTFLGFILSCSTIMMTWPNKETVVAMSMPLLIFGVPIFDMTYTTISRFKNGSVKTIGEWLSFVGKDHFHHRLVHMGFSDVMAVIFIYAVTFLLGLSAVALTDAGNTAAILLLFQAMIIFFVIVSLMLVGREIS